MNCSWCLLCCCLFVLLLFGGLVFELLVYAGFLWNVFACLCGLLCFLIWFCLLMVVWIDLVSRGVCLFWFIVCLLVFSVVLQCLWFVFGVLLLCCFVFRFGLLCVFVWFDYVVVYCCSCFVLVALLVLRVVCFDVFVLFGFVCTVVLLLRFCCLRFDLRVACGVYLGLLFSGLLGGCLFGWLLWFTGCRRVCSVGYRFDICWWFVYGCWLLLVVFVLRVVLLLCLFRWLILLLFVICVGVVWLLLFVLLFSGWLFICCLFLLLFVVGLVVLCL